MDQMIVPFNKPFIVGKELYYIAKAVSVAHLSGDGPYTKLCHQWFEQQLGCRKALLTHSCTAALEMAAILCGIEQQDEIIMPSFTFVSTANAFVLRGGVPVFVDIRPDTLNLDETLIADAITPRTKAIVPVHYAGVPCAMDTIMEIAEKHNLIVIEDAAQSLLSSYKDRYLGTIGHLGCLSFHETKNIISGEGGALLINHERFFERSEIIRDKGTNRSKFLRGQVDKYTWVDIGSSYLPSELIGAFLYAQLEQAEAIIAVRQRIVRHYIDLLKPLECRGVIQLPFMEGEGSSNGHIFYILVRDLEERTKLIEFLLGQGINAIFHYVPLHSSPAGIRYGRAQGMMTNTDELSSRIVRLPMFYEMDEADVEKVVDGLVRFFQ